MNQTTLERFIQELIHGELTPEGHALLREELKRSLDARSTFREMMDLESGLRAWAAEGKITLAEPPLPNPSLRVRYGQRTLAAVIALLALIAILTWLLPRHGPDADGESSVALGEIRAQEDCVWNERPKASDHFYSETLSLTKGAAELTFRSGTTLVLEGPCRLQVISENQAKLLLGNVTVKVAELSDGFTLSTPEASIIDESAMYAVSLTELETEIHVFEGLAHWEPISKEDQPEPIRKGEARRYSRSNPSQGVGIPFGRRKFVWEVEAQVQEKAQGKLLAYDGFEYLAGRLRRGRSGFGWEGGWNHARQGSGKIGNVVDAPNDIVFGMNRAGRRLLQLSDGESIRRELAEPLRARSDVTFYVSFLLRSNRNKPSSSRFFQLALSDAARRGHRSEDSVAIGITSQGFPYIKVGSTTAQTAAPLGDGSTYLCTAKIRVRDDQRIDTFFRVYHPHESGPLTEPKVWTTVVRGATCASSLSGVILSVGPNAFADVDELRIGTTWQSITTFPPQER